MRKTIAILLAALMLMSVLAACGDKSDGSADSAPPASQEPSSSPADAGSAASPPAAPGGSATLGWYPDAYEASLNRDKYSIAYITIAMSDQLHSAVNVALREWAAILNCDYVSFDAKGDSDAYLSAIETYAAQGLDGLILDDIASQTRSVEICEDHNTKWFPALSTFLNDERTHYIAPAAILANYDCGVSLVDWTMTNFASQMKVADVEASQIGYIYLDYSPHPDFAPRLVGALDRYNELYPGLEATNWLTIDVLPGSPANTEGAFDLVSAYLSTNGGDFDYWIIGTSTDEFAIGATRAVEQVGMEDKCMVAAIFGGTVIQEWATGKTSAWKASVTIPIVRLTELMICGLLAILDGRAEFEDLHRDYVPAGENYGIYTFTPQIFTFENKDEYYLTVEDWIAHEYP